MPVKHSKSAQRRRMRVRKSSRPSQRYRSRDLKTSLGTTFNDKLYYAASSSVASVSQAQIDSLTKEDVVLSTFDWGSNLRATSVAVNLDLLGKETITDTVSKTSVHTGYGYIEHMRSRFLNVPFLVNSQSYNSSRTSFVNYYWRTPLASFVPSPFKPGDMCADWNRRDPGFSSRAWNTMLPRFEGEISLINFIWELKDFRSLAHTLRKLDVILHNGSSLLTKARKVRDVTYRKSTSFEGGKSANTPLDKVAAELNLFWQYMVKPTISDIQNIAAQLMLAASEAQSKYIQKGQTNNKRHYSETQVHSHLVPGTYNNFVYGNGVAYSLKRVAEFQYNYDVEARESWDLFTEYWGLTLTAESVWNMIPLSFLFDYMSTMAKTLRLMRRDNHTVTSRNMYGESLKLTQSEGVHIIAEPRVWACVVDGVFHKPSSRRTDNHLLSGHEYTYYKRHLVEPSTIGFVAPRLKMPSMQQGLNVLSLARCMF